MKKTVLAALCLGVSVPAFAEEGSERLPGHRAVYELRLAAPGAQQAVIGAKGRYVFELEDLCEGYTLNERLVVQLQRPGGSVLTDYRLSAFESDAGDLYRFSTATDFDGKTGIETEGTFSGGDGEARIDYKTAADVSFSKDVLPPLAHMRAVLEAALAGEERHAANVFDGDVERPVFYAVTRIKESDAKTPALDGAEGLDGLRRWRLDSAYFAETGSDDETGAVPEFNFSGILYENGVVDELVLDYIDFALNAGLVELSVGEGC